MGRIFVNSEGTSTMQVIDEKTLKVVASWPLSPCEGPTGIAYDRATGRLFSGCSGKSVVVDPGSRSSIRTRPTAIPSLRRSRPCGARRRSRSIRSGMSRTCSSRSAGRPIRTARRRRAAAGQGDRSSPRGSSRSAIDRNGSAMRSEEHGHRDLAHGIRQRPDVAHRDHTPERGSLARRRV